MIHSGRPLLPPHDPEPRRRHQTSTAAIDYARMAVFARYMPKSHHSGWTVKLAGTDVRAEPRLSMILRLT